MCLTNESKSPHTKPQYENGEIVCYVVARKLGNQYYAPLAVTKYKLGNRMRATSVDNIRRPSLPNYKGRHGILSLRIARRYKNCLSAILAGKSLVIIRCTSKRSDIIKFGMAGLYPFSSTGRISDVPALRSKAMFYQRVVT